jgi:hypothetical protein
MCAEEINNIVSELLDRYGREPLSKTKLMMALHYHLKNRCDVNSRNFDGIENKVKELICQGALEEVSTQRYVIA